MDLSVFAGTLLELVIAAVTAAFATLVPAALKWFYEKTKLDRLISDDVIRGYLNNAFDMAIAYAKAEVAKKDMTVDTDSAVVKAVYQYLVKAVPDALDHFGITEENVASMVKARVSAELPK